MSYPDRNLERWAAYASILSLPVGILSLVLSVLGVWKSYIAPYTAPLSPPPVPDGKRFWGDDAISNLFANFFSRPSLWIPVSLAMLLTYFALKRVRSKRSIEKMKE